MDMLSMDHIRDVTIFITVYLVLAVVPFLALNWEFVDEIRIYVTGDIVTATLLGIVFLLVVSVLLLADEGVDRYNQFLFSPTDVLSIIIEFSFVFAAISWWLVPEFATRYDLFLSVGDYLVVIMVCHVPMILFLSLMTAIGKA